MATSSERVRRMRARRAAGITPHACPQCGVSHYPETPVTHACPQCGHDHPIRNAALQVTPVAPRSHDGESTPDVTPVAPPLPDTSAPCPRCALATERLATAIAKGSELRDAMRAYRAYGTELEAKHRLALERIAALEELARAHGLALPGDA